MYLFFFIVCFFASIIGAICGIGGGVIIKPLLDMAQVLSVTEISFLSGITVLSMTAYSVVNKRKCSKNKSKLIYILSAGSAVGGIFGRVIFDSLKSAFHNDRIVGGIQSICLIIITVATLLFTLYKNKLTFYAVKRTDISFLIGLMLGILSSFLGIGGGPINLIMLYFFFSMSTKEAAQSSLFIIFFSQAASLLQSVVSKNLPELSILYLLCTISGGLAGGIVGKIIYDKINEKVVETLFVALMLFMVIINFYNAYQFLWV